MEVEKNVARLIENLKDTDELVQVQTTEMLVEIGEPAVDQLIDALNDEDKNIRQGAAKVLGLIGDEKAINPLITLMKDDNKWVRRAASGALSNMGESSVGPLIQTLEDEDWRVRG